MNKLLSSLSKNEWLILVLPMLSGFYAAFNCRTTKNAGSVVPFRPEPWFFSVIWPILYVMLGLSWVITRRSNIKYTDLFYGGTTLILTSWIIVYSCFNEKIKATWVLGLSLCGIILCMQISKLNARLMLTPLLSWAIFAILMNTSEVLILKNKSN